MNRQILLLLLCGSLLLLALFGCKEDAPPSINDLPIGNGPQPVIDSIVPAGGALAGVQPISIYGKNFSSSMTDNIVFFNAASGKVLSATQTRIVVTSPADTGLQTVKIAVANAVLFSANVLYKLEPAIKAFDKYMPTGGVTNSICNGVDANLYISVADNTGKDSGIVKITASGSRTSYASFGLGPWTGIKFGLGGFLYAVKNVRAVYRFAPGGAGAAILWASIPSGSFYDFDFDPNDNMWVAGNNKNIYKITQTAIVKGYPFEGNVKTVRYFNGYLYFGASIGSTGDTNVVYRAPIVADTLGLPEIYFNLSSAYPTETYNIQALTFSSDGDMYVGVNSPDYLMVVHPDKSFEMPYSLYRATELHSPCRNFAWIGDYLYAGTAAGGLLQITVRKQSAPYYGIQ